MYNRLKQLGKLFFTFGKIGLFTFGGGYAMLSLIESTCVEKEKWITAEEMLEIAVIAESTPGPIAINCATYVGCKKAGIGGALAATIGVVLPSFCIIYIIAGILDTFLAYSLVQYAFRGIQLAVGILIADAAHTMMRKMPKDGFARGVLLVSFGIMFIVNVLSLRFSSIVLMLLAAAAGGAVYIFREWKTRKERTDE